MIKTIRVLLEYNTYCLWLYDESDELIDNNNPPEWDDDDSLTNAFLAVCDLYDTFYINNDIEFSFVGCPDKVTAQQFRDLFMNALALLEKKNNGRYVIENCVSLDFLNQRPNT